VPKDAKILLSTWAMKKKTNGDLRARLNARGFEQTDSLHYNEDDKAAPVVNDVTIRIVLIMIVLAAWWAELLNVKGAFLNGRFQNGEQLYMTVPQGFEKFYPPNVMLLLLQTIYGLKQAAIQYWQEMVRAFKYMKYLRSKANPCLYFRWIEGRLIVWITWVDDCLIAGDKDDVTKAKEQMMTLFNCNEIGEMKEYVGCKVDHDWNERCIKLTQPVMIQSFVDKFELGKWERNPTTPADPNTTLIKGEDCNLISKDKQKMYCSGVGKLLHMMRWTRPNLLNAVRETSRFMLGAVD